MIQGDARSQSHGVPGSEKKILGNNETKVSVKNDHASGILKTRLIWPNFFKYFYPNDVYSSNEYIYQTNFTYLFLKKDQIL